MVETAIHLLTRSKISTTQVSYLANPLLLGVECVESADSGATRWSITLPQPIKHPRSPINCHVPDEFIRDIYQRVLVTCQFYILLTVSAAIMQLQSFFTLASLALLGNAVGTLADLEADEVPQQCRQICQSIVQRSQECDRNTHDDHAEKECMCKLNNASTVIPQCEACVAKYHNEVSDHSEPHDNGM